MNFRLVPNSVTLHDLERHDSSSWKGTSGLLHIIGSNTMIFCCFKAVTLTCRPYTEL